MFIPSYALGAAGLLALVALVLYIRGDRRFRFPVAQRIFCTSGELCAMLRRDSRGNIVGVTMTENAERDTGYEYEDYVAEVDFWKNRDGTWSGTTTTRARLIELSRTANGGVRLLLSNGELRIFESGQPYRCLQASVSKVKGRRTISISDGHLNVKLVDEDNGTRIVSLTFPGKNITFTRLQAEEELWQIANHWGKFVWAGSVAWVHPNDSVLPTAIFLNEFKLTCDSDGISDALSTRPGYPKLTKANGNYIRTANGQAFVSGGAYFQVFINDKRMPDNKEIPVKAGDRLSVNYEYSDRDTEFHMVDIEITSTPDGGFRFNGMAPDITGCLHLESLYNLRPHQIWEREPAAATA